MSVDFFRESVKIDLHGKIKKEVYLNTIAANERIPDMPVQEQMPKIY